MAHVGGRTSRGSPDDAGFQPPGTGQCDAELRWSLLPSSTRHPAPGRGTPCSRWAFGYSRRADIDPYPEAEQFDRDEEEQSIDLLYRNKRTYAIGHGCAAEWATHDGTEGSVAVWVRADPLPAYEVVSLTPNVYVTNEASNRVPVTVSMEALADGQPEGHRQVETVLGLYGEWIATRTRDSRPAARFQPAATRHMDLCREALERMRAGWELVGSDPSAATAFRLANEAMLYQQVRSRLPLRESSAARTTYSGRRGTSQAGPQPGQGNWRPFQIAFILASLPELVDRRHRPARSST